MRKTRDCFVRQAGQRQDEDGILIDTSSNEYEDHEKVEFHGEEYAICPEAYDKLDALLPDAVKYGLKDVFGHARKYKKSR